MIDAASPRPNPVGGGQIEIDIKLPIPLVQQLGTARGRPLIWSSKFVFAMLLPMLEGSIVRHRLICCILMITALSVCTTTAMTHWLEPGSEVRIKEEAYSAISLGMSRDEVEQPLGPPGDYRTGPTYPPATVCMGAFEPNGARRLEWQSNEALIELFFDQANCVSDRGYKRLMRREPNLYNDLSWRIIRRWRIWFR
jgi:hypothetical protein